MGVGVQEERGADDVRDWGSGKELFQPRGGESHPVQRGAHTPLRKRAVY